MHDNQLFCKLPQNVDKGNLLFTERTTADIWNCDKEKYLQLNQFAAYLELFFEA